MSAMQALSLIDASASITPPPPSSPAQETHPLLLYIRWPFIRLQWTSSGDFKSHFQHSVPSPFQEQNSLASIISGDKVTQILHIFPSIARLITTRCTSDIASCFPIVRWECFLFMPFNPSPPPPPRWLPYFLDDVFMPWQRATCPKSN